MGTSSKRAKDRCHKYFKVNVPIYEFLHKMTNQTDGISFTCFGFQMALRKDKDETFTIHAAEFRKYSVWSYSLAWANCTLNMLLGAITIFYNVKILARATEHCAVESCCGRCDGRVCCFSVIGVFPWSCVVGRNAFMSACCSNAIHKLAGLFKRSIFSRCCYSYNREVHFGDVLYEM